MLCLVSLGILSMGGYWGYTWMTQVSVTIQVNDTTIELRTDASTVRNVLKEAQISLDPVDRVNPSLDTRLEDGMVIQVDKANQLILDIDGDISRIYTHDTNPERILAEYNIQIDENDLIYVNHQLTNQSMLVSIQDSPTHLRVVRSKIVTVVDGDLAQSYQVSQARTVGDLLYENRVSLYLADAVSPSVDTPVIDKMTIVIHRSSPVEIKVDGSEIITRAVGSTVGDVLEMLDLALVGADYSVPSEETEFTANMIIRIIRVVETVEIEQSSVPYSTIEIEDPSLAPNEQRLIQPGNMGLEEKRIQIRRENGMVVSRVIQNTLLIRAPQLQVIAIGKSDN